MDEIESVEMKVQSVMPVKKCVIEPVEKLLAEPFPSSDIPFKRIAEVNLYLGQSRYQMDHLIINLHLNRCANDSIKIDVEKTVDILKKLIPQLEDRMEIYKQFVIEKNKKIDTLSLRQHFHDPKLFDSLMREILVVYEEPVNNAGYGDVIRNIVVELTKFKSSEIFKNLDRYKKECEQYLKEIDEEIESLEMFQDDKGDLEKRQKSLSSLLELIHNIKLQRLKQN